MLASCTNICAVTLHTIEGRAQRFYITIKLYTHTQQLTQANACACAHTFTYQQHTYAAVAAESRARARACELCLTVHKHIFSTVLCVLCAVCCASVSAPHSKLPIREQNHSDDGATLAPAVRWTGVLYVLGLCRSVGRSDAGFCSVFGWFAGCVRSQRHIILS